MIAEVKESSREGIYKYLGDKTDAFLSGIEACLEKYAKLWRLSHISFMVTNTVNLLFKSESELYGSCVLKMCIPGPEVATEINCLKAYDGQGFVKLWTYSTKDNILLLEQISPGDQMWAVKDYKQRAQLMAQRIKSLHFIETVQDQYPSYRTWMEGVHKKLTDMGGMDDALFYLNKALGIYDDLKQSYNRSCLLHGDMHHENLLLNNQGGYTIIDPKGVVDVPLMETARFLLNEIPCNAEKICEMVAIMAPIIGVPQVDMLKSMYIDAALGCCWRLEENLPTQESYERNKQEALEDCSFVYGLLV